MHHTLKVLKKAGLIELKKSGPRVFVAWPSDLEKLRDEDMREGLLTLREAFIKMVDGRMKERPKARP